MTLCCFFHFDEFVKDIFYCPAYICSFVFIIMKCCFPFQKIAFKVRPSRKFVNKHSEVKFDRGKDSMIRWNACVFDYGAANVHWGIELHLRMLRGILPFSRIQKIVFYDGRVLRGYEQGDAYIKRGCKRPCSIFRQTSLLISFMNRLNAFLLYFFDF